MQWCILYSSLALARAVVNVETDQVDARAPECIDLSELKSDYTLDLSVYEDFKITTLTVPGLPDDLDYSYAFEKALVALPKKCAEDFADDIENAENLPNKRACDPQGMKYVYMEDIDNFTAIAASNCSKGLVIGLHGSGGPGWGQVQYGIIFSGLDYIHVQPNSMAMPLERGLKGRTPQPVEDINRTNYCGEYKAFTDSCGSFSKPYCYSTKEEVILAQPDTYRKFLEGVYQIRKREMDHVVNEIASALTHVSKVYAVGNSEGAMVLNRYYNEKLHSKLSGMIFDGWSCEFNYFLPCQEAASICEDKCGKDIAVLNLIGDADSFFGAKATSMAQKVKNGENGYGAETITGNCHAQFAAQEFEKRTTVVFQGAGHTPKYWDDNLVRAAVVDFLGDQDQSWKNEYCCQEDTANAGLFKCDETEEITCPSAFNEKEICECCEDAKPRVCATPSTTSGSRTATHALLASYLSMSLFYAFVW